MDPAVVSLALTAGALAALNPCGFALLPGYLALVLRDGAAGAAGATGGGTRRAVVATGRALRLSGVMTVGFVLVFAGFGLLVAPVAASVQQHLPWVTLATGLLLAGTGAWLLAGRELRVPVPRIGGRATDGTLLATLAYGATYALASLTCTIAPFLAVVVTSLRSETGEGLVLFAAYAVGMGVVVGVAAVAVALARTGAVGRMRGAGRWLPRAAGALVLVVGAYVAWYGLWEVRVLRGADPADPVVDAALAVQAWLSDLVAGLVPDLG